jgi:hypothetical protein
MPLNMLTKKKKVLKFRLKKRKKVKKQRKSRQRTH